MTIETKFDVGDKVWTFVDNKPIQADVYRISFTHSVNLAGTVMYEFGGYHCKRVESEVFATKSDLINSL